MPATWVSQRVLVALPLESSAVAAKGRRAGCRAMKVAQTCLAVPGWSAATVQRSCFRRWFPGRWR